MCAVTLSTNWTPRWATEGWITAATIIGRTDPATVSDYDLSVYLRPSHYAEADKFYGSVGEGLLVGGYAAELCARLHRPDRRSGGHLTRGCRVCRDFAHLVVALLCAVNVPARVVSVYAPGLYPMGFHAVAEAFVEGQWRAVDGTLLASRQTLMRIATGRDAADIAFLDNHNGAITLNKLVVTAVFDGALPETQSTSWCRSAKRLRGRGADKSVINPGDGKRRTVIDIGQLG